MSGSSNVMYCMKGSHTQSIVRYQSVFRVTPSQMLDIRMYECHDFPRSQFGGQPHRSSSHCRSICHFPFVLSCFPTPLVLISLIKCCVFYPLFPPCLCLELFVCSACAHLSLVHVMFCTHNGYFLCHWFCIKLLRLLSSSVLLRLTSLPPVTPVHFRMGSSYTQSIVRYQTVFRVVTPSQQLDIRLYSEQLHPVNCQILD